jgi:hypothetical protein
VLAARLAAGDHRGEEDPGGEKGRGDEENRQLDVKGPGQVVGEDLGDVDPEEGSEVGAVVLRRGPHHRLDQEERRHHQEEPGRGSLRRGQRHIAGGPERQRRPLAPAPAEEAPAPEHGE